MLRELSIFRVFDCFVKPAIQDNLSFRIDMDSDLSHYCALLARRKVFQCIDCYIVILEYGTLYLLLVIVRCYHGFFITFGISEVMVSSVNNFIVFGAVKFHIDGIG